MRAPTYLTHQSRKDISKLDESCISNPKSENSDWTALLAEAPVHSDISDFGFEMQDSPNFKISPLSECRMRQVCYCPHEEGNFAHDTLYMQSLYLSAGPFQRSPLSASSNTMPYLGLKVPAAPSAVTTALA